MSHPSAERLLTLHGLRLSGLAPADRLAGRCSLAPEVVDGLLAAAGDQGLVRHRDRPMTGWILTPAGRRADARLLADELRSTGVRPAVEAAYADIRRLSPTMARIRGDWETRDPAQYGRNDHTDAAHDAAVVARLVELHAETAPVCVRLAAALDRFAGYRPRFAAALTRVQANEVDWLTHPLIDSYHTVWFELHEDLLSTLGVERSKEDMF
jgi:hypothetical protein